MKYNFKSDVLGLVNSHQSELSLRIDDIFINSNRLVDFKYKLKLVPDNYIADITTISSLTLYLYLNDDLIDKQNVEVNLVDGIEKEFVKELEFNNSHYETKMVKLVLIDSKNLVAYTSIREMIVISPAKDSKILLTAYRQRRGEINIFSCKSNSTQPIYYKINNDDWKLMPSELSILNSELCKGMNYFLCYTLDDNRQKIYSNTIIFNLAENHQNASGDLF